MVDNKTVLFVKTVAEKHLFNSALSNYIYILDPMRKGIAMASILSPCLPKDP